MFLNQEDNSSEHGELETLQEKIVTLTTSLATVMEQKSKMEASYQADKKKMMVCTFLSAGKYLRGLLRYIEHLSLLVCFTVLLGRRSTTLPFL